MIEAGMTNRAKADFLKGVHQPTDEYRMALYSDRADLSCDTAKYTAAEEVRGQGYTPGGQKLQGYKCGLSGNCAYITFAPVQWDNSTIAARAGLIYNVTRGGAAVTVVDFGEVKKSSVGLFRVEFPEPSEDGAVIWIS